MSERISRPLQAALLAAAVGAGGLTGALGTRPWFLRLSRQLANTQAERDKYKQQAEWIPWILETTDEVTIRRGVLMDDVYELITDPDVPITPEALQDIKDRIDYERQLMLRNLGQEI